jgi:hypothetical protein
MVVVTAVVVNFIVLSAHILPYGLQSIGGKSKNDPSGSFPLHLEPVLA